MIVEAPERTLGSIIYSLISDESSRVGCVYIGIYNASGSRKSFKCSSEAQDVVLIR